jgi:hypothetical protein
MIKKQIVTIGFILSLVSFGIVWAGHSNSATSFGQQRRNQGASPNPTPGISEHVFYGEVFSLIATLDNAADYQKQAGLSDDQTSVLGEIAKDCQRDLEYQDARAQGVIMAFRAPLNESDLKQRDPKKMPPVPAELTQLQEGRNAIVLHHRDRLKKALGQRSCSDVHIRSFAKRH